MRIKLVNALRLANTHHLQHLQRLCFGLIFTPRMMGKPGLGDLLADADHRIERIFRVLHNHGDTLTAYAAHLRFAKMPQVEVGKLHPGGGDAGFFRMQLQQRAPNGGLTRTGLADNRQLFAPQLEGDAAHGMGHRAAVNKVDAQIAYVEQRSITRCEDRGCHVGHLLKS